MILKELEQIKEKKLREFIKERVYTIDGDIFSRINYFNNKTLNKYIDVYTLDCSDLKKVVFYILNFKTKSKRLKENALKCLVDYNIKRVYVYDFNNKELLELGLKISGTYKNVFSGFENKYKLTIKKINFRMFKNK